MRRRAWIDNATVCELCLEAVKIPKCLGTKSMNAKEAREALGDVEEIKMPIPLCIDYYSQHMGGVDIADQLRGYDTQSTSFRAWRPRLFWAFDAMITSTYFISQDML